MIQRLILRLDTRSAEQTALADHLALAEALGAELQAQIEEDERLHALAGLGFVTEIGRHSARQRQLDRDNLKRRAEQQMRRLEAQLTRLAQGRSLHWSLSRISRATPVQLPPDAALLRVCSTPSRRSVGPQAGPGPHIAVLHAGDEASDRALEYARILARTQGLPILLLALPNSSWHRRSELPPGVQARSDLAAVDSARLNPLVRAWQVQLLLLPAELIHDPLASGSSLALGVDASLLITP